MAIDRTDSPFNDMEGMPAAERDALKLRACQELLAHAWNASQEARARLDAAGVTPDAVTTWDAWGEIPVLRKKTLIGLQQEHGLEAMLAVAPGELQRVYMSPGPIFNPEGREPNYWGWTEAFHAAGFRRGDLAQMTFGYHLTPAGLMLEEPLRELGCAVIPAGPGQTDVQLELMTRLPVTGFVGMASYLKVIKDKALSKGLDVRADLRLEVAFVAAERLAEELRRELEEELGMVVRQGYGTADVGCAAYECRQLTGMHVASRCHVEICDPATGRPLPAGEAGEVVITPFTRAYPLVRLATGDLSRIIAEPCPCGRTSPRLAGILGRTDDTTKVKGQFLYPHQVNAVAQAFPMVRRWQLVVGNAGGRETLTMRLLAADDPAAIDTDAFGVAFQASCKLRPAVQVVMEEADLPEDAPRVLDERTY